MKIYYTFACDNLSEATSDQQLTTPKTSVNKDKTAFTTVNKLLGSNNKEFSSSSLKSRVLRNRLLREIKTQN